MAFQTQSDKLIWNILYTVRVPDYLTLDREYIRKRGVIVTNEKNIDAMINTSFTTVMVPIAKILEYFTDGIEIQIPSRQDMITMHKDIEIYLAEWKEHIKYDINLDIGSNKDLLVSLEKLSKYIYNKAKAVEVISKFTLKAPFGLLNTYVQIEEDNKVHTKGNYPDMNGINKLIRSKTAPTSRY